MLKDKPLKKPFWMFNKHIETIASIFFLKNLNLKMKTQRVFTPDYDFIDIDFVINDPQKKNSIIIFHGLEGSSKSFYCKSIIRHFSKKKWNIYIPKFRSCGDHENWSLKTYNGIIKSDILFILSKFCCSNENIFIFGTSLGASNILNVLGECHLKQIKKVFLSSPVLDFVSAGSKLSSHFITKFIYGNYFLKKLKRKLLKKKIKFPGYFDHINITDINSIKKFDDLYTAPFHGFHNAYDYWEKANCSEKLNDIKYKTYILISQNDPICISKYSYFSEGQYKVSNNVNLYVSKFGGHSSFLSGFFFSNHDWFMRKLDLFFESFINE